METKLDSPADPPVKTDRHTTSPALLKVRLVMYSVYSVLAVIVAAVLVPVDFSQCEDLYLKNMFRLRFVLYSFMSAYLQCGYCALSLYIDWKALTEGTSVDRGRLQRARHFLFTTFVFPSIVFAGSFFWIMWNMERSLIVPLEADKYMPYWSYHLIHTVTIITACGDVLLVPRFNTHGDYEERVLKYSIFAFGTVWFAINDYLGIWPYPFLYNLTHFRMAIFSALMYYQHVGLYRMQWYLADLRWGSTPVEKWPKIDYRIRRKGF